MAIKIQYLEKQQYQAQPQGIIKTNRLDRLKPLSEEELEGIVGGNIIFTFPEFIASPIGFEASL